jgi:hypothetical protein
LLQECSFCRATKAPYDNTPILQVQFHDLSRTKVRLRQNRIGNWQKCVFTKLLKLGFHTSSLTPTRLKSNEQHDELDKVSFLSNFGNIAQEASVNLQRIEIDWDIHKMIEGERRGFDEPPHLALRRLLGLQVPYDEIPVTAPRTIGSDGLSWIEDGVEVPHGSLARMKYNYGRQIYEGTFLNGRLVVNEKKFDSLSAAANFLAVTKEGGKTQLNGWNYWEVQIPGETKWTKLRSLRSRAYRDRARR